MYDFLLKLWLENKISLKGLENALEKGWITITEKEKIEGYKVK